MMSLHEKRWPNARWIVAAVAAMLPCLALAQRPAAPTVPDTFGYRVFDQSAPECPFQYVDIAGGGSVISLSPSGAGPAFDDGGAVVPLSLPFELYGQFTTDVVVSSNGYLAIASSLAIEDGGDFSNDAILPAIPGNAPGTPARVLVHHDDLSGDATGGMLYEQHFAACPRPSEPLGAEPCTVFQWADWQLPSGGGTFDFQAILYHGSFGVVIQIVPGAGAPDGATIGIQNRRATVASQYRPNSAIVANTAICFLDPRFPSGGPEADLEVSVDNATEVATPGESLTYEIGLLNRGPSPVTGATLSDNASAALVGCTWSCVSSPGSSCTTGGSGPLLDQVDLQPLGWADYRLTCTTAPIANTIVYTLTAAPPIGVPDPVPANNSATDVDLAGAGRIPDGAVLPGPDVLRLERLGSEVRLSWGNSCLASDDSYAVYRGALGDFESHDPLTCDTAGAVEYVDDTAGESSYYLVVPTNGLSEGSYGLTGVGAERTPRPATACLPQAIGSCF
jgi:uncharacterized repeat protein (TIGR01451 family)